MTFSAELSAIVLEDVRTIAGRLRRAADLIEERADRPVPLDDDLATDHSSIAADVVHEIMSMMANLRLNSLVLHAHDADVADRYSKES